MPIQPINYLNAQSVTSPFRDLDFAKLLQQGMQLSHEPQRLLREKEQQELANRLGQQKFQMQEASLPFAGERAQAEVDRLKAQTEKERMMASMGGMQFPGGAGLVQSEGQIGRIHGIGSPEHNRAIEFNNALLNQRKSGIGRLHAEIENISEQLNNPYLPESKKNELQAKRNQLENKAFNEQSDLDVRQKGLGAKLMEQTWDTFISGPSMDALKKYTGAKGSIKFYKDALQYNLTGVAPDADFDNYLAARNELYTLSDQYMKAFPGSQNYQRMESVHNHVNPSGPLMAPGALEASIKSTWKTIEPELKTYTDVLHGKNPLREETGGGAHNETIRELNKKTLKQQQESAKKQGISSSQNKQEKPAAVNWVRVNGKWVKK